MVNSALPTALANSCVVYHSRTCCLSTNTASMAFTSCNSLRITISSLMTLLPLSHSTRRRRYSSLIQHSRASTSSLGFVLHDLHPRFALKVLPLGFPGG